LNAGGVKTLTKFRALSKIVYSDFYPPITANQSARSECKSTVDFDKYKTPGSVPGFIPAAQVLDPKNIEKMSTTGVAACPSATLYTTNADQSCTPLFDPNIRMVVPAKLITPEVEGSTDE
jgi:hypothetical protein